MMVEIDKICKNDMYKQFKALAIKNSKIDIDKNNEEIIKKAVEIANELHINSEIIKRATIFTSLGLYTQEEDYIKLSGVLAVRILNELNEDEDTTARILMAIAGQGNNGNSVNVFSAIILLANFIDLKSYLIKNRVPEELANSVKVKKFDIVYDKKEINYEIEVYKKQETYQIVGYINKIIENSANMLNLKVKDSNILYV